MKLPTGTSTANDPLHTSHLEYIVLETRFSFPKTSASESLFLYIAVCHFMRDV